MRCILCDGGGELWGNLGGIVGQFGEEILGKFLNQDDGLKEEDGLAMGETGKGSQSWVPGMPRLGRRVSWSDCKVSLRYPPTLLHPLPARGMVGGS